MLFLRGLAANEVLHRSNNAVLVLFLRGLAPLQRYDRETAKLLSKNKNKSVLPKIGR